MEKEFKEIIEASKESLKKAEKTLEELSDDFSEEAQEMWSELKNRFTKVNDKLQDAYKEFEGESELQANLSMMEARDTLEKVKKSAENFAITTSKKPKKSLVWQHLLLTLLKWMLKTNGKRQKRPLSYLCRI